MIIDLSLNSQIGLISETYKFKSDKLIREITLIKYQFGYNIMIIPMSIYNIIENDLRFHISKLDDPSMDDLRFLGSIYDINVFLDFMLPPEKIVLKFDKMESREKKIESLFGETLFPLEKEIIVLGCY